MKAHVRRLRRRVVNKSTMSSSEENSGVENLRQIFEKISLKDIPLEERRKEANKPLYLVRYE